ncbi:MAG: helix-turn-helix transcriptional regulator [Halanaerobiales bacterium]
MAWLFVFTGAVLFFIGLVGKLREYKTSRAPENVYPKNMQQNMQKPGSAVKLDVNEKNVGIEYDHIQQARQKRDKLKKINNELEELIEEISKKEKRLKNSVKDDSDFAKVMSQAGAKLAEEKLSPRQQKILKLSSDGLSPEEIAEEMDIGVREARLILRMRGKEVDKND